MKQSLVDVIFYLTTLTTCVVYNKNQRNSSFSFSVDTKLSDNFSIITSYHYLESDDFSPNDYEIHEFAISFYRNGKIIGGLSFQNTYNSLKYGPLADTNLDVELKLEAINAMKPGLLAKIKLLPLKSKLTDEEEKLILKKTQQLFENINTQKATKVQVTKKSR